ncbi:MAG: tRNA nucleotidyltransferase (CCA-adding enzyme) [Candidatus Nanohaloarchaea archaeon]|jgi:tRNA nucleotidyltransferase (CCA-adding enzyme)
MNWERLRKKVIERTYPDEEDFQEMQELFGRISSYIEHKHGLEVHFAGSASRKTCMKGDKDLDMFLMFPEDTSRKELEEKGISVGKDIFNQFDSEYHVEYAEHPYTKGHIEGTEVEVVPCYDIPADQIKSSVDRTPHHSKWSQKNLGEEQRRDVVVLKKFLSAKELYGSSLKVKGFSGYLCEILIHEYGSFRNLIEEASNWPEQKILDPESHHENGLPEELQEKFSEDNLVVVDPVDPERNVSAVLNTENYTRFIYEAVNFLDDMGMHHFEKEESEYTQLQIKNELDGRNHLTVIEFNSVDQVDDIVYPQIRKAVRRIEQLLEGNDFTVYASGFHVNDKTRIYFETEEKLSELRELKGPKLFHGKDHVRQFKQKYDNTYVKNDRLCAKTERDYLRPKQIIQDLSDDPQELKKDGIPEAVAQKMSARNYVDPLLDNQKWLNFLGEELHVNKQ